MDYETKATNRNELRACAFLFRHICELSPDEPIDPLILLEKLPDIKPFRNVGYEIVEDSALEWNVPAQCDQVGNTYTIKIKNSVYTRAYEKRSGGDRMHITHEIMHAYADMLGFKPIFTRRVTKDTPPYKRLEWVVKALAGEVMMPYTATENMSVEEIMSVYGVSKDAAKKRKKY